MNNNLIIMLTYNDVTVSDAIDVFETSKNIPVKFWGFKDIGLNKPHMKQLVQKMRAVGKTTFLEVVHYEESECIEATKLALECGFDYLTGTICFDSIIDIVKNENIKYFPFFGKIYDHPVTLGGTVDEIIEHGKKLKDKGVDGLDLVAYRYECSEKIQELIDRCVKEIDLPLILAGSINDWERIKLTTKANLWAFTIGSAFFDKKFVKGGLFNDQIVAVSDKLKRLGQ
ncbi:MAG: hypothetical protein A2Y10_10530 [Planctomycetes bacterium GWF2_41_51]|nr:MAG: hypothetical protein A2Y10_10530 [Planctomycetes bacterium GWF2_41_51]HBG26911.1 hypothetical protein [Phycisphaerales bacterium]